MKGTIDVYPLWIKGKRFLALRARNGVMIAGIDGDGKPDIVAISGNQVIRK